MIPPVLICGGIGKRLWLFSWESHPKQFVPFDGELSLFQTCAQRLSGSDYDAPIIVTNSDFRFIVAEQLAHIGIEPSAILIEPNAPKTGYDYLDLGDHLASSISSPVPLNRFVEEPDVATAKEMVESRKYLWNSGMFLFSINTILEKCDNLVAITFSGKWNDLGDWGSVWAESQPNFEGVATSRLATAIDCKDVLLRSESKNQVIVGIGLNDVVSIAMPDAVLSLQSHKY